MTTSEVARRRQMAIGSASIASSHAKRELSTTQWPCANRGRSARPISTNLQRCAGCAKASFRGHITFCGFFLRSERGFHTPFLAVDLGQLKEQVQLQADAVLLAPKTVALSALTAECSAKQAKSVVDRSTPHSAADARLSVHSRASISERRRAGEVIGAKRRTAFPWRSTKNFVKFHLMARLPRRPGVALFSQSNSGLALAPLTSILANIGKLTSYWSLQKVAISSSSPGSCSPN